MVLFDGAQVKMNIKKAIACLVVLGFRPSWDVGKGEKYKMTDGLNPYKILANNICS